LRDEFVYVLFLSSKQHNCFLIFAIGMGNHAGPKTLSLAISFINALLGHYPSLRLSDGIYSPSPGQDAPGSRRDAGATRSTYCWVWLLRIDTQVFGCLLHYFRLDLLFACQGVQRAQHDVFCIHLEEIAERCPILASAETIRA
jgi:hypothetical protein